MRTPMRRASLFAVTLLTVAVAFWGGAPAIGAGFPSEQAAPATGSSPPGANPPRDVTLEERADVFMARKNYDDAIDYYYRALKHSTFKDPAVWNKLGIAFQEEGKNSSARKAYTNATRADKSFAEAWNNIGTLFFAEKKFGKSVPYYQRAIKIRGDTAVFHINLGASYLKLKKRDQAVEEYCTALGIDPKVLSPESLVGTVVHASGTDVEDYFYIAKALASKGDAEAAVRYLRRALEDGFSDRQRIDDDPDFKKISQYPAFVELMRNPPVSIKN